MLFELYENGIGNLAVVCVTDNWCVEVPTTRHYLATTFANDCDVWWNDALDDMDPGDAVDLDEHPMYLVGFGKVAEYDTETGDLTVGDYNNGIQRPGLSARAYLGMEPFQRGAR